MKVVGVACAAFLVAAIWPSSAGTHAGHGAIFVTIAQNSYRPASVDAITGDTVMWSWEGPDRNHSVTADDGRFDSDPGRTSGIQHDADDAFTYRFTSPGTFTYHCKVHPSMTGRVVVTGEDLATDTRRPEIIGVEARKQRRRLRVAFGLSEAADYRIRVRRRGRTLRSYLGRGDVGETIVRLSLHGIRPGRYRVTVTARDHARNTADPASVRVRIR